jgi:hypothetical protein
MKISKKKIEDIKLVTRIRKSKKGRTMQWSKNERRKDEQYSTKYYTKNYKFIKNEPHWKKTHLLQNKKQTFIRQTGFFLKIHI